MARKSPYESAKPEIVIGIIARMGVDVGAVVESINAESLKYRYKSVHIKLTGFLKDIDHGCNLEVHSTERRYTTYIEACNKARSKAKDAGFFSYLATQTIGLRRSELQAGEHRGIVYIVDQLKRPEEVQTLREIYGDTFIALSCHAPIDVRIQNITDRITGDHPETGKEDFWRSLATQLVDMDEAQDDVFGQAVRSTFPLADFILDSTTKSKIEASTNRLFRILFGDPGMSPTFAEYGNNMAAQAAYRSIDLSRQVGAAIFDDRKKILALGCNEVPAFDGGTYWPSSETDRRDHKIGYDANTIRKRGLVLNVVDLLKSNGSLSEELSELSEQELQTKILDEKTGILRDAEILDILEYGRALHAEMNAITDVARSNSSTQGATLFVTTFPCHNCAKHIVGAGIKEVFYLEPFPKSQVQRLYPDSIEIDPDSSSSKKVIFRQFCGITKRRFALFAKGKLKNSTGKTVDWKEATAKFLIDRLPIDYSRLEEKHSGIAKSLLELVGPNPGSANS